MDVSHCWRPNNTQEQHCASIIKLISHVVTQHLQWGVLGDTGGDAPMVMTHVIKIAVTKKSSCFREEKGFCGVIDFFPQLQVGGGALHKHHMAELGSDHVDQFRVPDTGLVSQTQVFFLFLFTDPSAFILHNSHFIFFLSQPPKCFGGFLRIFWFLLPVW